MRDEKKRKKYVRLSDATASQEVQNEKSHTISIR
jgi:hypothetical protein